MLTELERIAAEQACARLTIACSLLYDSRDAEGFVALWSEDGVWETTRGPMCGHDTIRRHFGTRPPASLGRHITTNVMIAVIDAEHATGTCYFTYYSSADPGDERPATIAGPQFVGQYFDTYVKTGAGWRLARRRMDLTFKFS